MVASFLFGAFSLVAVSLAATTTTIVNPAISATPSLPSVPTATDLKGDISFSVANKSFSVREIPNLPPHVNLTCRNCSATGTIELAAGGYSVNDSAIGIAMDFFDDGFLKFVAHGVSANISTAISLTPGFQVATIKVPLFTKHLFTLPMGKLGDIDIFFEVFIPIALKLNSEVDVLPQLTLTVPDNSTLYLDFGSSNNSFITGFNESVLTPSFDLSAPNLSFTILTGVDFLISANSTIGNAKTSSAIDLIANFNANLGLPILNTTVTELNHVNGTCDPPRGNEQVYESAIGIEHSAHLGLDLTGQLSAKVGNFSESWAPPAINVFNRTFPLPTGCFKFDPLATGLIAATATLRPTATPVPTGGSPSADSKGQDVKTNGAQRVATSTFETLSLGGVILFGLALLGL